MTRLHNIRGSIRLGVISLLAATVVATAHAQTLVKPGFNLFSVQQDIDIGNQSAITVAKQLPMLSLPTSSHYLSNLGAKLAARAPGAKYPYRFTIVNLSDVNAFALPGGAVYINRGLLEAVRSEGQLAGVMAHEIAHVALRHATNQASKAYLSQVGIGILGGLLGAKQNSATGQIVGAVGGFGLNTLFLKYSRNAETQADIVGAQIMAKAGYDPMEMVTFFESMRQAQGTDPGKVAQFLSDHPAPVDREARVRQEMTLLGPIHRTSLVGNVALAQAELRRLPPARTMAQVASNPTQTGTGSTTASSTDNGSSIPAPSQGLVRFRQRQGLFEIDYPSNWTVFEASTGYGATIAPGGGVISTAGNRQSLAYGVVVNHYVPFEGSVGNGYSDPQGSLFGNTPLEEASSDLVRQIMAANPSLTPVAGSQRHPAISGASAFSVALSGRSRTSGVTERVTVFTRELPDGHVIYLLMVAPDKDYAALTPVFDRMVRSLKVNARALHS